MTKYNYNFGTAYRKEQDRANTLAIAGVIVVFVAWILSGWSY